MVRNTLMVVEPPPQQPTPARMASNMSVCPVHGAPANARPQQGIQFLMQVIIIIIIFIWILQQSYQIYMILIMSTNYTIWLKMQIPGQGSPRASPSHSRSASPMPQQARRQMMAAAPSPSRTTQFTPYRPPQGSSTSKPEYMLMDIAKGQRSENLGI